MTEIYGPAGVWSKANPQLFIESSGPDYFVFPSSSLGTRLSMSSNVFRACAL